MIETELERRRGFMFGGGVGFVAQRLMEGSRSWRALIWGSGYVTDRDSAHETAWQNRSTSDSALPHLLPNTMDLPRQFLFPGLWWYAAQSFPQFLWTQWKECSFGRLFGLGSEARGSYRNSTSCFMGLDKRNASRVGLGNCICWQSRLFRLY